MKATTEIKTKGLKNRSELLSTPGKATDQCPSATLTSQLRLRLVSNPPKLKPAHPYRLRAGDFVLYNNRICPVLRVNECCAVITVMQAAREFTTIFGKCVRIPGKPKLVRIASNSEIPILKRQKKGGRK